MTERTPPGDGWESWIDRQIRRATERGEFDVGEHARAMIYSVTEGEDKPLKYPVMFRSADVVFVNKIDLLPHLDVDLDLFVRNLRQVNPAARVIEVSARTGAGVEACVAWVREVAASVTAVGQGLA